ncbi:uncharacterized protein LOC132402996 isoform X2 [Hypanus sabinus]|uniref:uncharacterized protein LOC132402996 isoform X2 n=1 Tax=Hypanus sabinus TaxID=79690 RepID=UPI0028C500C8|nr:uncharacterized protein LOC132402996 isoform X2 [Hypanus sabinus]
MQNQHRNSTAENMTGIYLGVKGSPPRFNHIAAIPPLFRRLSFSRAKTPVENQRFRKIEMLRSIEPMQGFKGAAVKAKVKSVIPEVELYHQHHKRSTVLSAEELSKLARKVLMDFGIPRENNSVNSVNLRRRNMSPRGKLLNSTYQPSIQELSVVMNSGRSNDHCRTTLPKQKPIRNTPRQREICEKSDGSGEEAVPKTSVKPAQPGRRSPTRQLRSSKAQHLAMKCLQSSPVFTKVERNGRTAKTCSRDTTEDKILLPSSYISGSALLLPQMSISLGRVHMAGHWGYKMPKLNTTLGNALSSNSLEPKQRIDGNNTSKLVTLATSVNGNRVTNGLGRLDETKRRNKVNSFTSEKQNQSNLQKIRGQREGHSSHSLKVCSIFNSGTRTSPHSERNGLYTDRMKGEQPDSYESNIPGSFKIDNSEPLEVEVQDLTKLEASEIPNTDNEKDDEESIATDSTVQLTKHIEVIINLKPKVEENIECSIEKDLQINSDETLE